MFFYRNRELRKTEKCYAIGRKERKDSQMHISEDSRASPEGMAGILWGCKRGGHNT